MAPYKSTCLSGSKGHMLQKTKFKGRRPHAQPAGGGKPDAGVEVGFEDGAVAKVEHVVAGGKTHQLTGAGGGGARVPSSGSDDSRAMNWAWAGLGTLTGSRSSAAAPARYL